MQEGSAQMQSSVFDTIQGRW